MADEDETVQDVFSAGASPAGGSDKWRRRRRAALASGVVVALALGYVWVTREEIADNVIQSQLDNYGIDGTYRIESIGPRHQVLTGIVIGDPSRPDLTVERAEIIIKPTFGLPRISSVRLVRARLNGVWRDGRVSFGALDRYLYEQETQEPVRLPEIDLLLEDARARILTPFGAVGAKAQGKGNLASGFAGVFAAVAPKVEGEGCIGRDVSLAGRVTTSLGKPRFEGPLKLERVDCASGLSLARSTLGLVVSGNRDFSAFALGSDLKAGPGAGAGARWAGVTGRLDANWRGGTFTGRYDVWGNRIAAPAVRVEKLQSSGTLRGRDGLSSLEWQGDVAGQGLAPGSEMEASLEGWRKDAEGTLFAPLLGRITDVLRRETPGSRLVADFTLRRRDGQFSLVVPAASLRGTGGDSLLALSRVQGTMGEKPQLSGNFSMGGGLPPIAGRVEQSGEAGSVIRLSMPRYEAAGARLAVPDITVVGKPDGSFGLTGRVLATGEVPGGFVSGLELPVSGNWSQEAGLALWRKCEVVRVERLTVAAMDLTRPTLSFCPVGRGRAIVEAGGRQTRIAARVPGLDLAGQLGGSPLRIRGGAVSIAPGGKLALKDLDIVLGPPDTATRLALSGLDMQLGKAVAGRFSGAAFGLYAVPLDVKDGAGSWRYEGGELAIQGASLLVEDRKVDDRFQPLVARDAQLTLAGNVISAEARLRNPESDREVTRLVLRHDLGQGGGDARLVVDDLRFDDKLQPDMLSRLLLGVVANASGTVKGEGRIDWDERGVTSSGEFGTQSLDFAAAFGPAQGVAGTVRFTDLVNLTTAPDQFLTVRSINPGIEVFDGRIGYELVDGSVLSLRGGRWPFLGGSLVMDPVDLRIGVAETRRYVLHLEGVDAGQFVQRMELGNISATGAFDGTLPLVFDENGGRLDGGILRSREPGGNLSYVGELTYKDLTPMANLAFDALRSLDYRQMRVELNGPLTGEIVTRVVFDGIRQGASAKRNFVTKQVAKLPIRFNVNIHAPFYRLITTLKSMYDPAMVRDPRELGLLDRNGNPVPRPQLQPAAVLPVKITQGESIVQRPESEDAP